VEEWLVADGAWWGPGRRYGRCAVRLVDGLTAGEPVPLDRLPPGTVLGRRLAGTVVPGLVDAHVHAGLVDLAASRAGGLAGCHDLGGVPADLAELRRRSHVPGSHLPRLEIAGAFLTAPGGYPSDRTWAAPSSWREVAGPADAGEAVAEQVVAGASMIKISVHVDAGPVLSATVLRAIVDAAHGTGRPVVVHAEGDGAVRVALEAGADRFAHTPWTEQLDPGMLRACAERTSWISTIDIHGWGAPRSAQARHRATAMHNLRAFVALGGVVRYGTDLGNGPLPSGVNGREIEALIDAGLGPDGVLVAMTGFGEPAGAAEVVPPCLVPGGLAADGPQLVAALGTARVVDPAPVPRTA
jgi:hypothetical protein